MNNILFLASLLLTVFALSAPCTLAVPTASSIDWHLPRGARIEGDTLVAEIAPDATGRRDARAAAEIDVADALADGCCIVADVRCRATGVTEPDHPWNGVKVQLRYRDIDGKTHYPGAELPRGTFDWTNVSVRVSPIVNPRGVEGGRATLLLGLEGCTGRAEFDLSSLRIDREDTGIPIVNQDWVVRYPDDGENGAANSPGAPKHHGLGLPDGENGAANSPGAPKPPFMAAAQRRPPLRGCMLPQRATTEDDIETLHRWGATLARFQITRDFGKVDANSDLAEYAAWVDSRLDNLAEVLGWAQARGMKVCVDLHATPGGVRAGDRATAMLYDERLAGAFVETWRHIATRCAPAVQTACAPAVQTAGLYGYDLVNEPKQIAFAPISYWDIQRRAAEAIREIDPDTPIIVESNDSASAGAFRYLSPLAMDNVIYQLHMYAPGDFTHQGVGRPLEKDGRPLVWPDSARGWDIDWLRRALAPVREFQTRHRCRIYVGEFSAAAWAPGADQYLRDCIGIFEEYGWDWTYHAFREWPPWSVEHEVPGPGKPSVPSADNPRKQVLLEGFRQQPTAIDYNRQQSTAFDSLR